MIFQKSYFKILELIYNNPGIILSNLINKAKISVDTAKNRLNILLSLNIIIEERIGGGKKALLKRYYSNLSSEEGKNIFSLVELKKKNEFFGKNQMLRGPFSQLAREIGDKVEIILIFGSFANYSQTKDSDLDILLLTDKKINKDQIKKSIERSFITFNHEISPRLDNIKNFRKNNAVYQTIKNNHVVVYGALKLIENLVII